MDGVKAWAAGQSTAALAAVVVAALLAVVVLIALFLIGRRGHRQRQGTFVLLGLCNSGKTVLYHQLRYGQCAATQSSLDINEATFPLHTELGDPRLSARATKKAVHLVDIPGHEKMRFRLMDYEKQAGGIIFMIDAAAIHQQLRQVAEYLYDILATPMLQKNRVPVLVVLNKGDLPTSQPLDRVEASLQNEFNTLRKTRSAAPDRQSDDTGREDRDSAFLGYDNKPFEFADLENQVEFVECTATAGGGALAPITDWIRRQYPC